MSGPTNCLSIGETEDDKQLKMEQACRDLHHTQSTRGFNSRHLHQFSNRFHLKCVGRLGFLVLILYVKLYGDVSAGQAQQGFFTIPDFSHFGTGFPLIITFSPFAVVSFLFRLFLYPAHRLTRALALLLLTISSQTSLFYNYCSLSLTPVIGSSP